MNGASPAGTAGAASSAGAASPAGTTAPAGPPGPLVLADRGTFALLGPGGEITGRPGAAPDGLFARDARHLSRWELTVQGRPLTVLTADAASAVLVAPGTRDAPSPYTVLRMRALSAGTLVERLTLLNNLPIPLDAALELTVDADFADQFELRSDHRHYAKPGAARTVAERADGLAFHYRRGAGWSASTEVTASPAPHTIRPAPPTAAGAQADGAAGHPAADPGTARTLVWCPSLPPHGRLELALAVRASAAATADAPATTGEFPAPTAGAHPRATASGGLPHPVAVLAERLADAAEFIEPLPEPAGDWPELGRAVRQGLADLAALRVPATGPDGEPLCVPGAGIPWFLTLFGRDALLTSLFCLPYRPALTRHTLLALAAAQGTAYDPGRVEQPGRIPHELRHGELAHFRQVPYGRYYGSVDATPLFLVLLHAYTEATADRSLAVRLESHARAAAGWMFRDGGLDQHGWLVYTSDEQAGGLANQNWKDSAGAVCFADGTQASGAVAVAEAQGYAYDALSRTALLAADIWDDPGYARRLRSAAQGLKDRFPAAFWLPDADFPALALDGRGRRADVLASDAGHLLWSGLLDEDRAGRVVRRLVRPDFFSGWGIRTLACGQSPYHPLSYHRGAVWPHDNAVIALGMARYGFAEQARLVASGLVAAAEHHAWRLPEVLSGYGRDQHSTPIPYPHACSPQAWSAATPLALLTATTGAAGAGTR